MKIKYNSFLWLRELWQSKLLVTFCVCAVLSSTLLFYLLLPKLYKSDSTLAYKDVKPNFITEREHIRSYYIRSSYVYKIISKDFIRSLENRYGIKKLSYNDENSKNKNNITINQGLNSIELTASSDIPITTVRILEELIEKIANEFNRFSKQESKAALKILTDKLSAMFLKAPSEEIYKHLNLYFISLPNIEGLSEGYELPFNKSNNLTQSIYSFTYLPLGSKLLNNYYTVVNEYNFINLKNYISKLSPPTKLNTQNNFFSSSYLELINEPLIPLSPYSPKPFPFVLIGLLLGFLLSICTVAFRFWQRTKQIVSLQYAADVLDLPILGELPSSEEFEGIADNWILFGDCKKKNSLTGNNFENAFSL
jgi:hypothetical protein